MKLCIANLKATVTDHPIREPLSGGNGGGDDTGICIGPSRVLGPLSPPTFERVNLGFQRLTQVLRIEPSSQVRRFICEVTYLGSTVKDSIAPGPPPEPKGRGRGVGLSPSLTIPLGGRVNPLLLRRGFFCVVFCVDDWMMWMW